MNNSNFIIIYFLVCTLNKKSREVKLNIMKTGIINPLQLCYCKGDLTVLSA